MKQLLQSSFVVLAMLIVLIMSLINTCQLDNLEQQVIETNRQIERLMDEGGGARSRASAASNAAASEDPAIAAALADPDNLLKPPLEPLISAETVVYGETLRMQLGQDPKGLNFYVSTGADLSELVRWMTNRLGRRDRQDPGYFSPELAYRISAADDGKTYTVDLRKGVYWHRPTVDWGSPRYDWLKGEHELTSDDFAFVFEILANPQVAGRVSTLRNYFEGARFEAIDRYSFKVEFRERFYTNLPQLIDLIPMPRWLYQYSEDGEKFDDATWGLKFNDHWYNRKFVGVGPYRFVSWEPGVKILMERNKRYWDERPGFDRVIIEIMQDQNGWLRKFRTGEYDFTQIQPEQYKSAILDAKEGPYLGREGVKLKIHPTLGYFYIGWNLRTALFEDKRVRRAMTMAMNREAMVKNVFYGLGKVTTGPTPQQSPCYDHSIEPWPFDLKRAAALLDEAGWRDSDGDGIRDKVIGGKKKDFSFTLTLYGNSTEFSTVASIYREDLLSIGIKMATVAVEWSTMLKTMDDGDFDAYTGAWVANWENDWYQLWHSTEADRPKSSNRIYFKNKQADRLIEEMRLEFDRDKQVSLCKRFHALMHEEQPYTFFYQRTRAVLYWDYMNELLFSLDYPYRDIRFFSFKRPPPR